MAKKNEKIGKVKRSTNTIIVEAIERQNSWMSRRRESARKFLKKLNIFNKKENDMKQVNKKLNDENVQIQSGLIAYWFPILCVVIVILIALWTIFIKPSKIVKNEVKEVEKISTIEKIENAVERIEEREAAPLFDIVRIDKEGVIVVAGRWVSKSNVSILLNKKIVATERTNENGEFVYTNKKNLKPGNYTIALISENNKESDAKVFVYIPENGYEGAMSLLFTKDGSKILQAPSISKGDLIVSKIDYLDTGRIVITGKAIPKLRVSITLNDEYLGFTRVSNYKNFGIGKDIKKLVEGNEYTLLIKLHDSEGNIVSEIKHNFTMPKSTGFNNTFYKVRKGDCLWMISKNFLNKGVFFTVIAQRNHIKNPNIIYVNKVLSIPVKKY